MNRTELVKAVAAHTTQDPKQVDTVLGGLTEVITALVARGEKIVLPGFAKFAKVERAARMGRNPATGEQIHIKASKKARITAMKGFKDTVMSPSAAPKLARGVWPTDPALLSRQAAERKATVASKAPARSTAPTKRAVGPKRSLSTKKAPVKKAPAKKATTKRSAATKRAPARKVARRR